EGRAIIFLMASRAVLDLAVDGECAARLLEFFQRFTTRVVIGVDEFGSKPVGELGVRFDFKLEEEHVALNCRIVARRSGSTHPVINESPVQVRLIREAADLLVVLFWYEPLPPI